jgi:outer membrane lipoprotein-sorting protein
MRRLKVSENRLVAIALVVILECVSLASAGAQQLDNSAVVQGIDTSVKARLENVKGYTVTEHYAVFRSQDEPHPAAEMTVRTVYRKGYGKTYTVLSESGSAILRSQVLATLLDNEKRMSQPGNVETALIDSANYEMKLTSDAQRHLDGRDCLAVSLTPRRISPYLFRGTLWVDAKDYAIVQLEGTAAKSPFFLVSAAQVRRQYSNVSGFPMATHTTAVSKSSLLGQTEVKVDYTGYQVELLHEQ